MRRYKKSDIRLFLLLWVGLLTGIWSGYGQQDPMYTQYMFNTLSVNPAYAGSYDALSLVGLYRTQWVGLDGAPVTQTFTVHTPVHRTRMGLGLSVVNDAIGPVHQTQFFVDYSYTIDLSAVDRLSFGLKGGFGLYSGDLSVLDRQELIDPLAVDLKGEWMPNIGVGIYYHSERGYLGLSAPKLLRQTLTVNGEELGTILPHFFLIGGYLLPINQSLLFKPSFLVKAVEGAPLSVDLTGMVYLQERLGLGLSYRHGDSFSGLLQVFFTPSLWLGYSYDYTLTPLKDYNSGTHEISLGYDFWYKGKQRIRSPRFF